MKPEEKEMQLDIIRRQLGLSEAGEELGDLFDGLLASALMHSNRTSTPDALLKLVRDAVCAAWRRRGDEGSTGSTAEKSPGPSVGVPPSRATACRSRSIRPEKCCAAGGVTEAFSCPCSVPACTALKLSCEHHCPARTRKPFGLLSRS